MGAQADERCETEKLLYLQEWLQKLCVVSFRPATVQQDGELVNLEQVGQGMTSLCPIQRGETDPGSHKEISSLSAAMEMIFCLMTLWKAGICLEDYSPTSSHSRPLR